MRVKFLSLRNQFHDDNRIIYTYNKTIYVYHKTIIQRKYNSNIVHYEYMKMQSDSGIGLMHTRIH